jgi:hypothetical protein
MLRQIFISVEAEKNESSNSLARNILMLVACFYEITAGLHQFLIFLSILFRQFLLSGSSIIPLVRVDRGVGRY